MVTKYSHYWSNGAFGELLTKRSVPDTANTTQHIWFESRCESRSLFHVCAGLIHRLEFKCGTSDFVARIT